MDDPLHYGRWLRDVWNQGSGFVIIEDDVVPWPGAIRQLLECDHDWCLFEHPRTMVCWEPRSGFATGLGCVKFSDRLVQAHTADWGDLRWDEVELGVRLMLADNSPHIHYPPVAHLKASTTSFHRHG